MTDVVSVEVSIMLCLTRPGCAPKWPLAEELQDNDTRQQPIATLVLRCIWGCDQWPFLAALRFPFKIPSAAAARSLSGVLCLGRSLAGTAACYSTRTAQGDVWYRQLLAAGRPAEHKLFPWKTFWNSHLILAHAICTWGESSFVLEPQNPSFINCSETEMMFSHFGKLCQNLLAAACSGKWSQ